MNPQQYHTILGSTQQSIVHILLKHLTFKEIISKIERYPDCSDATKVNLYMYVILQSMREDKIVEPVENMGISVKQLNREIQRVQYEGE